MNLTGLSNWRYNINEIFENLRIKATWSALAGRLLGKKMQLKDFAVYAPKPTSMRVFLGERDIPVRQITGSVGREKDFDSSFRPLKKHLRDRWVEIYSLAKDDRLPPIQVFKIGNEYFVEDGHHRVSVASALGQLTMRARVWDVPLQPQKVVRPICKTKSTTCCKPAAPAWHTKGEVL